MTNPLQILQLTLFGLSILTLLIFGGLILARPVNVINRRWYLAVLLPLLLANPLAVLEDQALQTGGWMADWRIWLVLAASIGLLVYFIVTLRGTVVYGLPLDAVQASLAAAWTAEGLTVEVREGEKPPGSAGDILVLAVETNGVTADIKLLARFKEVRVQPGSAEGQNLLRHALPALRKTSPTPGFTYHAASVLYLVMAVVFAVMGWIFFFEPRLVLLP